MRNSAARKLARLEAERELMLSLQREGVIEVEGEGSPPFRSYLVSVTAETCVVSKEGMFLRSSGPHRFRIEARGGYPRTDAPVVAFITPPPCHVNVYSTGQVCIGHWDPFRETLASETVRTIRVLLLDKDTFNFDSIANHSCNEFCQNHTGGIPDGFPLPCPVFDKYAEEGLQWKKQNGKAAPSPDPAKS